MCFCRLWTPYRQQPQNSLPHCALCVFADYGLPIDNPSLAPQGPKFLKEPEETTILSETSAAYLDCLADGNPKPDYVWYKESGSSMTELGIGPGTRFILTGGRLTIDNPQDIDEGTYQCWASNEFGTILSRPVDLAFGSEFGDLTAGFFCVIKEKL